MDSEEGGREEGGWMVGKGRAGGGWLVRQERGWRRGEDTSSCLSDKNTRRHRLMPLFAHRFVEFFCHAFDLVIEHLQYAGGRGLVTPQRFPCAKKHSD